ncbi:MAG: nitroreductase family deazaflavin-dependent oxidoreductase [Chloroflexi bacterium]|nr:nitroreductase family deazaflavin-dependent oxidoreductase [Chloroflexota bacterium]MCC6892374.1 nitroreductase family deazaflavin-dependent oxidoreductase [Anaerolineae bacterium]
MRNFLNTLANRLMKPLLASPLHFVASNHVLLIAVTGRKSGSVYVTPLEYRYNGEELMLFTQQERRWWRNLIGGAPVMLVLRGKRVDAYARPFTADQMPLSDLLRQMYPYLSDERRTALEKTSVYIQVQLVNEI